MVAQTALGEIYRQPATPRLEESLNLMAETHRHNNTILALAT